MMENNSSCYFLCEDIFLCQVDDQLIFLDLNKDKYWCLPPQMTAIVKSLLTDGTGSETGEKAHTPPDPSDITEVTQEMIENNLLTSNPEKGKKTAELSAEFLCKDLEGYTYGKKPKIKFSHMYYFCRSALRSLFRLRFYSLKTAIKTLKNRKEELGAGSKYLTLEEIHDLVECFKILQPLFFKASNHCLFDSFTLMEFLACYGLKPTMVFGVKMRPFKAHCWVQEGDTIFNDSLDHANLFTPIMAI